MSMQTALEEAIADLVSRIPDNGSVIVQIISRRVERDSDTDEVTDGSDSDTDNVVDLASGMNIGVKGTTEPCLPNLGCAATQELLTELAERMDNTQNSIAGRELGRMCRDALDHLAPGVLAYRTYHG